MVLKIDEKWAQQRAAELEVIEQMRQADAERKAANEASAAAFDAKVQATRRARENALANGGTPPPPPAVPTWDEYYRAKHAEEITEQERIEAERIAAIPEREKLIMALPAHIQRMIADKEDINPGWKFPLDALQYWR